MTAEKKEDLLDDMDDAARELLKASRAGTMDTAGSTEKAQPVDLKDRIAAFGAVITYLAMKNKIRPEAAKRSGIDKYRDHLNGGTSGSRTGRRSAPPAAPLADTGEDSRDN